MTTNQTFESIGNTLHNLFWPTVGTVGSGTLTVTSAKDSSFLDDLWNIGIEGMFNDWSRQDTYTIVGFTLTIISLKFAWESIKINRERLAMEKIKNGRNSNSQ